MWIIMGTMVILIKNRDEIWNTFFKLYAPRVKHTYVHKKVKGKKDKHKKGHIVSKNRKSRLHNKKKQRVFEDAKYTFHHQIVTDGVGCTVLLIRKDLYKKDGRMLIHNLQKPFNYKEDRYIDDLSDEEKLKYEYYQVVGIDPGKHTLIHATNRDISIVDGKYKTVQFRYTQDQRRVETKSAKYAIIRDNYIQFSTVAENGMLYMHNKKNNEMNKGKTIKEIESELCKFNSHSCIYNNALKYTEMKIKVNKKVYVFYASYIFRQLRWYSYINRQKTDSKMINNFKKTFGPLDTLICFGDWSQKKQMKYKEPTKGKSYRRLFKKAGFPVFLVNEFNTSKKCFLNGLNMIKFRTRKNPKYKLYMRNKSKQDPNLEAGPNPKPIPRKYKKSHGLLRSSGGIVNNTRGCILMDRDLNGSLNIWKKGFCILRNQEIPDYLTRKKQTK